MILCKYTIRNVFVYEDRERRLAGIFLVKVESVARCEGVKQWWSYISSL